MQTNKKKKKKKKRNRIGCTTMRLYQTRLLCDDVVAEAGNKNK